MCYDHQESREGSPFHFGYVVRHLQPDETGYDAFRDMRRLSDVETGAILFDVGANVGQSVALFRARFKSPIIHSFEASPSTFKQLKERTQGVPDLHLNNFALGAHTEQRIFQENANSTLSSFLPIGKDFVTAEVTAQVQVEVNTIDSYCSGAGVEHIDVLKTDTQGFDYEVLKGAVRMMQHHKIHLIFVELQLLDSYVGAGQFEDVYILLKNHGFLPMAFYKQTHHGSHLAPLAEIDGLFLDQQFGRH